MVRWGSSQLEQILESIENLNKRAPDTENNKDTANEFKDAFALKQEITGISNRPAVEM